MSDDDVEEIDLLDDFHPYRKGHPIVWMGDIGNFENKTCPSIFSDNYEHSRVDTPDAYLIGYDDGLNNVKRNPFSSRFIHLSDQKRQEFSRLWSEGRKQGIKDLLEFEAEVKRDNHR